MAWGACMRFTVGPFTLRCAFARSGGSLLLNEEVKVVCENQRGDRLDQLVLLFHQLHELGSGQPSCGHLGSARAPGHCGIDLGKQKVRIRHYDARMVIPLSWDEDGITECTFVTRAFYRGKSVDQLQMHLKGGMGLLGGSFFTFRTFA